MNSKGTKAEFLEGSSHGSIASIDIPRAHRIHILLNFEVTNGKKKKKRLSNTKGTFLKFRVCWGLFLERTASKTVFQNCV